MPEGTPEFNPEKKVEMTEIEAAEALQTEQTFSPETQEYLVSKVTDPNLSMYILGFDDSHNKNLTRQQAGKLLGQALKDMEVVEIFYTTLTESGVDLNENEIWWLERIRKARGMDF